MRETGRAEITVTIYGKINKHRGNLFNGIKRGLNSREEFLSQAGALHFVPPICHSQVPPNLAAVDGWQGH